MWQVFRLRSIRRKLFLSLALAMAALAVQAVGGLTGLLSYRSLVRDLDREFSGGPHTTDVLAALSAIYEPLVWPQLGTAEGREYQQREVRERFVALRDVLNAYHRRLSADEMPPDRRLLNSSLLQQIDQHILYLATSPTGRLTSPQESAKAIAELQTGLAEVQLKVLALPRAKEGYESKIDAARRVYATSFWMILVSIIAAAILFSGLIQLVYRWIFQPIRELHQGASRVAQGDFGYRMQVRGTDEMAQLADKFNQMTGRFQEIRDQLDGEVRARTKQALRSERLAGVGFLSAGVAHEINNPLSAIAMAAESLESRIHEAEESGGLGPDDLGVLSQYLGMIQREAFRCQQITQRLLSFARGQDTPHTQQDLTKIIGEVLDMVGHMSRFRGYEIVFDRTKSVPLVVNGAEIKQVVLNLVANALESMSGTGRLEITVVSLADEVVLAFRDNGCGMTPHVLENLFEPFFTSKPNGRGTGLGLSITNRIVTDHGGRIEASSDGPGLGSTFKVHLPRRAARKAAA